MRRFKIFCLILVSSWGLLAQSLKIKDKNGTEVTGDTLSVVFKPTSEHGWTELAIYLYVENTGTNKINLGCKKTEFNLQKDEYHSFCFGGMCFDSSVKFSPFLDPLGKGEIDSTFSGHFRFDDLLHKPQVCIVAYTFYNDNNRHDSATVYIQYNTLFQVSGIKELPNTSAFLPKIWPNPSSGFIEIDIPESGKFDIIIY